MTYRLTLRTAVLALGTAGAILTPATGALATDDPKPAPTRASSDATAPREATPEPTVAPTDGRDSTPAPAQDDRIPRGGVAAGERPATDTGNNTALYGTAAGTVLLAGAGTYVLRRRAGAQRNG